MTQKDPHSEQWCQDMFTQTQPSIPEPDKQFVSQLRQASAQAFAEAAASVPDSEPIWSRIMKLNITRWATAAVILIAVILGMHFTGDSLESKVYAQVVQALQQARTLAFTRITPKANQPGEFIEARCEFKDPCLLRITNSDQIIIANGAEKKAIGITPEIKVCADIVFTNAPDTPHDDPFNETARLRAIPAKADTQLGTKQLNGRTVQGYRVTEQNQVTTVWIDLEQRELVQVEVDYPNAPDMNYVLTDFEFNRPMADSYFALTPPEGYTKQEFNSDVGNLGEQDLIAFCRMWSSVMLDGTFPPTLDGTQFGPIVFEMGRQRRFNKSADKTFSDQANQEIMYKGMLFSAQLPPSTNWRYVGASVTMGSADTPIFWYRPEGSSTYRVIYGDLTIKDVLPEDLPK